MALARVRSHAQRFTKCPRYTLRNKKFNTVLDDGAAAFAALAIDASRVPGDCDNSLLDASRRGAAIESRKICARKGSGSAGAWLKLFSGRMAH